MSRKTPRERLEECTEQVRLNDAREEAIPWKKWGPYLSERQWGTVREDYSEDGDAWDYFTHDQARSRAYRWGEDGLAGICDDKQRLCFALALWNGDDPILKERCSASPTRGQPRRGRQGVLLLPRQHADALVHEVPLQVPAARVPVRAIWSRPTRSAAAHELEYELLDTGVFDDDRYFDVFVEYAKARTRGHPDPDHGRTTAGRRRPRSTCCRRCGSATPGRGTTARGERRSCARRRRQALSLASHPELGERYARLRRRLPSCCSPRTRPTPSGCAASRTRRRTSRTRFTRLSSSAASAAR